MGSNNSKTRKNYRTYFTVICSNSLILFLLGVMSILYYNAHQASKQVYESFGMTLLISDDIPDDQLKESIEEWKTLTQIKDAEIITKESSAHSIKQTFGRDAFDVIGYNPMKRMVDITLHAKYAKKGNNEELINYFKGMSYVQKVHYHKEVLNSIRKNLKKITTLLIILGIIFIVIFVTLLKNTIQVSLNSKRELIRNMRLVGASNRFIRSPFLKEAFWIGFIGASIALVMIVAFIFITQRRLYDSMNTGGIIEKMAFALSVYLLGIGLSVITTRIKLYSFLKAKEDIFYY